MSSTGLKDHDTDTASRTNDENNPARQYDIANPAEELSGRETAALDQIEAGLRDGGPSNNRDLDNDESSRRDHDWDVDLRGGGQRENRLSAKEITKMAGKVLVKRGGLLAGGGIIFGLAFLLMTVLGPSSMLLSLMENFTLNNDSASTALEKRALKVLRNITDPRSEAVCSASSKIKCKMGKITSKGLKRLAKKGVVAVDSKGVAVDINNPTKNPTHYRIEGVEKPVRAEDLTDFLTKKENRKFARKVLGAGGAFNLRFRTWSSKHLAKAFYNKFNLSRAGGLAKGSKVTQKIDDLLGSLKKKIPGSDMIKNVTSKITKKVTKHVNKLKKGGVGYLVAVSSCIAVKAPGYIAAGVAAIQLAQILPFVQEIILSPASKQMAAGSDNKFTAGDASSIGNLATEKHPRPGDGKLTSLLDSRYLLYAMGVNRIAPPISKDFTPGFGYLSNPVVKGAERVKKELEPACNVIMSPQAMYAAMAGDIATTVALSSTVILGLAKVLASFVISELIARVLEGLVSQAAQGVLDILADNPKIPNARGEELGDVVGISAMAFFASAGMARNLPVLKKSQLKAFNAMRQENENFQREMDIAALSPFDTSSRHTFLGSILHNTRTAMMTNGAYSQGLPGIISTLASLPALALSPKANAANGYNEEYCGYAEEFGLEAESDDDTPGITASGLPCTGITQKQADIETEEAIKLIEEEGWLDDSVDIPEEATIPDLISKEEEDGTITSTNYIKPDTPLFDFITTCGDSSTGDYIFNAAGCTVNTATGDPSANINSICDDVEDDNGEAVKDCLKDNENIKNDGVDAVMLKNPASIEAITPFLIDYQIAQSINGNDEDDGTFTDESGNPVDDGAGPTTIGTPDNVQPLAKGWTLKTGVDYSTIPCPAGTTVVDEKIGVQIGSTKNASYIKTCTATVGIATFTMASLAIDKMKAMLEAAQADGKLTSSVGSSFRSSEKQAELRKSWCARGNCGGAANPGGSQHERGLAIDFNFGCTKGVQAECTTKPTPPLGVWLRTNSAKYGFYKLSSEAWHWDTSGK